VLTLDDSAQFKIVPDTLREEVSSGRSQSPVNQALKGSKTIFIAQDWDSSEGKKTRNRLNSSADYYGLKMKSGQSRLMA
jgi:hypothetical protein